MFLSFFLNAKLKDEFARLKGWRMLRIHYKDFKKIEEILQKSSLK